MTTKTLPPDDEFVNGLRTHAARYEVELSETELGLLGVYFELTMRWNARLHLVAPCTPTEFATRHVLESLAAARFIEDGASIVDVGSGGGLPVIPCLVVRPNLKATLVESSAKKTVFLREALRSLGRHEGARVVAERFEKTEPPEADYLTCRALERFTEMLPALLDWSRNVRTLLLFGGTALRAALERAALSFNALRLPDAEQRYLFVARRA